MKVVLRIEDSHLEITKYKNFSEVAITLPDIQVESPYADFAGSDESWEVHMLIVGYLLTELIER